MAVSSGAPGLEAAVVLGDDPTDPAGEAAVRDVVRRGRDPARRRRRHPARLTPVTPGPALHPCPHPLSVGLRVEWRVTSRHSTRNPPLDAGERAPHSGGQAAGEQARQGVPRRGPRRRAAGSMRVKWSPSTCAARRVPRRPSPRRRRRCSARRARSRRRGRARSSTGTASGTCCDRVGDAVPLGHLRRATRRAGRPRRRRRRRCSRRGGEVEHAGLRHAGRRPHGRVRAGRAGRQAGPPGGPHGQLPAGRVPDRDHAVGVDVERGQVVDAGRDVVEGRRPAAAVADPAVLEVPAACSRARRGRRPAAGRAPARTARARTRRG